MSKRFLLSVAIILATFNVHLQNLHTAELDWNAEQLHAGNSLVRNDLCTNDADCDDQDPCTQETCLIGGPQGDIPQGICIAVLNPNPNCDAPPTPQICEEFPGQRCCRFQNECDDGNPFTNDMCV